MHTLVVNAGSSTLKLSVVSGAKRLATSTIEAWDGEDLTGLEEFLDHAPEVEAVGHRVVHGGHALVRPVHVDEGVLAELDSIASLAPLHNPPAVNAIRHVSRVLDLPTIACFDTAFHATIPDHAATYALPASWNERWWLRRYGAHGLSHSYVARRAPQLLQRPAEGLRLVSCHLGSGASLAAVRDGRSVDTTMGFTPQEGLVMATRAGSVDPGLLMWLLQHTEVGTDELSEVLEHGSGLAGLSGTSGDMRDVVAGRDAGNEACALALGVYVHRLAREVAAMTVATGGLDVLVFTGGVGEGSGEVRAHLGEALEHLGVRLDPDLNREVSEGLVSPPDAQVSALVVKSGEDLEIARQVEKVVAEGT